MSENDTSDNEQNKSVYIPPPIEKSVNLDTFPSLIDRYYSIQYAIDICEANNDHRILIHSNRLCIITLAPSHPIICLKKTILKLDFQVSENVNRLKNTISGKRKRGAQKLNQLSPICFIHCSDASVYTIYAIIPGRLLEINERLHDKPQLLACDPLNMGYVAIIMPDIHGNNSGSGKQLLTQDQYEQVVIGRKLKLENG